VGDSKPPEDTGHWWGSQALSSMGICLVCGIPLLLAFGLGMFVLIYGWLAGLACGLIGLARDRKKGRALVALAIVAAVAAWIAYVRR
jgi:hypothetical protein